MYRATTDRAGVPSSNTRIIEDIAGREHRCARPDREVFRLLDEISKALEAGDEWKCATFARVLVTTIGACSENCLNKEKSLELLHGFHSGAKSGIPVRAV